MRTIASIIVIALIVFVGFLIFRGNDGDLARDRTNATTTEDLTGIGGPEEGFDPLEDFERNDGDMNDDGVQDKG